MTNVPTMDREVDRSQMQVSDEVAIEISNMNKWYGTFHVLRDINLTVNRANASSSPALRGRGSPR